MPPSSSEIIIPDNTPDAFGEFSRSHVAFLIAPPSVKHERASKTPIAHLVYVIVAPKSDRYLCFPVVAWRTV